MIPLTLGFFDKSLIYKAATPQPLLLIKRNLRYACIFAQPRLPRVWLRAPRNLLAQPVKSLIYKAATTRNLLPQPFAAGLEDVRAQPRNLPCGGLLRPPQRLRVHAPLLKPKNEMEN
jgi:hypothetical protein